MAANSNFSPGCQGHKNAKMHLLVIIFLSIVVEKSVNSDGIDDAHTMSQCIADQ